MEGVTDWAMRDLLTEIGGIDQCVTEFLRVTDNLHGDPIFYKNCPELLTGSLTRSGTPVFVQLLGGKAQPLAANALRAAELGALGIDLNFGCPAKTVNRHDGGATLLKSSDRLYNIVKAVRDAVPKNIPVTAKIRLGFDEPSACLANAEAIEAAGADWLTVHCRTKTDGYKPPAYWEWIAKIKEVTKIKIVTNGEICN
jgi:tRNA-dihydrouridine synthase C